ncbi:peptidoglycan DD-metalloendopeptidase family protein [Nereida sp. MMG024]|nr:peptidoglycan DD-metalloendopeptidase family protein [Nereida sp. MMG025]
MSRDDLTAENGVVEGDELQMVEAEFEGSEQGLVLATAASEAFLDIRGEPMIIVLPEEVGTGKRRIVLNDQLHPQRGRKGDTVVVIEDQLFDATQRVQITLPSSSSDLAAFQRRRGTALVQAENDGSQSMPEVAEAGVQLTFDDNEGSWGEVVDVEQGDQEDLVVSFIQTSIENTITEAPSIAVNKRSEIFQDSVIRVDAPQSLRDLLQQEGLTSSELDLVERFLRRSADVTGNTPQSVETVPEGGLIAVRLARSRVGAQLLHMSLYSADRYIFTVAQPAPGRFELSADPWFEKNLLRKADIAERNLGSNGKVKLKDAIYATALRNGMSSELVGELMVMLARVEDLDRIAEEEDRILLVLREDAQSVAPAGRILFVELKNGDKERKCYVVRPREKDAPYGCFEAAAAVAGPSAGQLGQGFLIPVSGVKTSGFGPRHHPILKRTVNHNGVDWAAPTGTPIQAVADGRVSRANFSGSYGNIIYIDHPNGAHSRYAHMKAFAEGVRLGSTVKAGDVIGYVGTTGRSTGPHLHFELHLNGRPVDPFSIRSAAKASGAVEALVNQIIRVESAGDARAKNSRSSATGLGQFIESTWLRMMRTYRPDLTARLNRKQLLDLRFDPELSRAMVTNLARENEAFLRARGHQVTPGRLYLAHFLGPSGAHVALRSDPNKSVLEVMGAGVVGANPFLKGRSVGWMTNWSDRKMARVGRGNTSVTVRNAPTVSRPAVIPAEVKRYQAGIDGLLKTL